MQGKSLDRSFVDNFDLLEISGRSLRSVAGAISSVRPRKSDDDAVMIGHYANRARGQISGDDTHAVNCHLRVQRQFASPEDRKRMKDMSMQIAV